MKSYIRMMVQNAEPCFVNIVTHLTATVGSFYKIENRLFYFCGIFERGGGFFLFSDFWRTKMELFVLLKLFAREDGFLSFGVLGGLTPRLGESVYPPPQVPPNAAQVIRWKLRHRQQLPNTPRRRPGTSPDRQSTYHGHILSKAGSSNIRTQQNKYLVAFASVKRPSKNLFLLKMLGKRHVLLVNACMQHTDTLLVSSTWTK